MDITLDEIKLQCRIDGDSEDDLLKVFLESAKTTIENYTNRKLFAKLPVDDVAQNALEISADLKVAILMLVAYLYENRIGVNESTQTQFELLPPTIKMIVERYTYITV
ncbi:MAG: head-tail connector protein [[Actinobacillus] rossii]|nr:head-tail connector protein [[Actinobacillus] rossii]MDY4505357.1 head-tail connector protein [[Actinobacillus] rossii]